MTYRSVEERGPVVLVTHPRERLLATGTRHIISGPELPINESVRARFFGEPVQAALQVG